MVGRLSFEVNLLNCMNISADDVSSWPICQDGSVGEFEAMPFARPRRGDRRLRHQTDHLRLRKDGCPAVVRVDVYNNAA